MRKEKNAGKEPLLYINQPRLEDVKGNMQVTYRSTKKKLQPQPESKQTLSNKKLTAPEKHENKEEKYFDEQFYIKESETREESEPVTIQTVPELPERKTAASAFKKLKPFRDLSIEEKLDYISESISGKVPFPCEFSNGHMAVKGVILEDDGNELTVKSFQGEEVKMKKNELQSIKMIGLQ